MSKLLTSLSGHFKTVDTQSNSFLRKTPASKKKHSNGENFAVITSLVLIVALTATGIFFLKNGIGAGAIGLKRSYDAAYSSEKGAAYDALYQMAFKRGEENYHVKNRVIISIGNLEESEKLEVLKANDIEFITENKDSNSGKVTAWLEVEGEGTFVVDLKAAEFIIDNERIYVLVRLPNPELTNINIIKPTRRLFIDDFWDGDYKEGVELAEKQLNEANIKIQKALLSNQFIFNSAKDVAVNMIQNLVKQFNPDIPDLIVDVEFMDNK